MQTVYPANTINRGANDAPGVLTMRCFVVYKSEAWHHLHIIGWTTWEVNPSEDGYEWATMIITSP